MYGADILGVMINFESGGKSTRERGHESETEDEDFEDLYKNLELDDLESVLDLIKDSAMSPGVLDAFFDSVNILRERLQSYFDERPGKKMLWKRKMQVVMAVFAAIAEHRNVSPATSSNVYRTISDIDTIDFAEYFAKRSGTPPEVLDGFVNVAERYEKKRKEDGEESFSLYSPADRTLFEVVGNKNVSPETLSNLWFTFTQEDGEEIPYSYEKIVFRIIRNPHIPEDVQKDFMTSDFQYDADYLCAFWKNPGVSSEYKDAALQRLLEGGDEEYYKKYERSYASLLEEAVLSPEIEETFFKTESDEIHIGLAENKTLSFKRMGAFSRSPKEEIRAAVARNKGVPPFVLEKLSKEEIARGSSGGMSLWVLEEISNNKNAWQRTRERVLKKIE